MSNKFFYVHNGLTVGSVTIDATTGSIYTPGTIYITSGTAATTTTNGALQVTGGAGIQGALYVGGSIYSGGYLTVNSNNVGSYAVTATLAGAGISISGGPTGAVTITNTGTLQSVTNNGAATTNAITINNATNPTTSTNGALVIGSGGGIGVAGNAMIGGQMQVWGATTFSGPVIFNGTSTYAFSTNTYYTDNILELHVPPGGIGSLWGADDGKDIGLRFHYYNRTSSTDSNAALVLADDSQYLEWYQTGSENAQGQFTGTVTYGTFKTGAIILTNTTPSSSSGTGALQVAGGIGVGGNSYIGGNLTVAGTINATISGSITTATNLSGGAPGYIPIQYGVGQTSFIPAGSSGQLLQMGATNSATWVSTSTLVVGNSINELVSPTSTNANYFLEFANTFSGMVTSFANAALYFNPSNGTLYSTIFNGSFTGNGANITGLKSSNLDYNSITVNTGTGIQVAGSPVALGGVFTITNTGVTSFLGGTTGLTGTNQIGVVTLTGTLGTANGGTNATTIGNAGTVAYSNGSAYAFLNSSTNGYVLTQGTNTPVWSAPTAISVGTATNLSGITAGAIPIGSPTAGVVSYINTGAVGTVLTMAANNTATWQTVSSITGVGQATTATNIAFGTTGAIPIQSAPGITSFINTGAVGTLLQMQVNNTASFVSTSSLLVGYSLTATNLIAGTAGQLVYQSAPGVTGYVGPGSSGQILQSAGTSTPVYVNQSTLVVGTATNTAGGSPGFIPIQSAAGVTSFIQTGTVGYVLTMAVNNTATWQAMSSLTAGLATTATDLASGFAGAIPIQVSPGITSYINTGAVGTLLQMQVNNTASFVSTSSLIVGYSVTATNLGAGTAGQIVYQSAPGVTAYAGPGSAGQILQSAGTGTPVYVSQSTLSVGTATNVAGGTPGLIPIQSAAGTTSFISTGAVGTLLVMAANNTATFQSTTTFMVGNANLANSSTNISQGSTGAIPIQAGPGQTSFIPLGPSGYVLTAGSTTATWQAMSGIASGSATTATNIASGVAGNIPIQTANGLTSFISTGAVGTVLVMGTNTATWANTLTLAGGIASTSTATGTLIVNGGAGINGNVNINGSFQVNTGNGTGFVQNETAIIVGTGATNIDQFSTSTYRSAKYMISVSNTLTPGYQTTEMLVIHDGVTPYAQETSVFTTAQPIMTFNAIISGGNVQIQGTGAANNNTVKVQRFYITP